MHRVVNNRQSKHRKNVGVIFNLHWNAVIISYRIVHIDFTWKHSLAVVTKTSLNSTWIDHLHSNTTRFDLHIANYCRQINNLTLLQTTILMREFTDQLNLNWFQSFSISNSNFSTIVFTLNKLVGRLFHCHYLQCYYPIVRCDELENLFWSWIFYSSNICPYFRKGNLVDSWSIYSFSYVVTTLWCSIKIHIIILIVNLCNKTR